MISRVLLTEYKEKRRNGDFDLRKPRTTKEQIVEQQGMISAVQKEVKKLSGAIEEVRKLLLHNKTNGLASNEIASRAEGPRQTGQHFSIKERNAKYTGTIRRVYS